MDKLNELPFLFLSCKNCSPAVHSMSQTHLVRHKDTYSIMFLLSREFVPYTGLLFSFTCPARLVSLIDCSTAERCNRLFKGYAWLKGPRLEPEGHRQDWHPHVTWAVGIKLHIFQGDLPGARWILWLKHIARPTSGYALPEDHSKTMT